MYALTAFTLLVLSAILGVVENLASFVFLVGGAFFALVTYFNIIRETMIHEETQRMLKSLRVPPS